MHFEQKDAKESKKYKRVPETFFQVNDQSVVRNMNHMISSVTFSDGKWSYVFPLRFLRGLLFKMH